jgi:UDP-glucose:(heptosyl)LPS alpha-1,3-glucosyltransferase
MPEPFPSGRRVALVIFRLAPAGGLEQHCLRLGALLKRRGCEVTVVTTRPAPTPGLAVESLAARGRTNHGRLAAFADDAARAVAGRFDVTVAFHAIPGFDVIFCADPSRSNPPATKRWLPRYATYARLERAAFKADGLGRALLLSRTQVEAFAANAGAPRDRLTLLAPTVDRKRAAPPTPADRAAARARLGLADGVTAWLWIGLQPKTKGLDRALKALAAAPDARLLVAGLDPAGRSHAEMRRLAERLGVGARATWLGFLDNRALTSAMAGSDLLVHPARADVTGGVILEAMANGLPVITTAVCGFGEHVEKADAGVVLAEPFRQAALDKALQAVTPATLARWTAAAAAYAGDPALFSGLEVAADLVLAASRGR